MVSSLSAGLAVVAQEPQDDRQAGMDRQQRCQPRLEVALPSHRVKMQPIVISRQIELADAAGDARALLDGHEPLVVAQMLAYLAGLREKTCADRIDLA